VQDALREIDSLIYRFPTRSTSSRRVSIDAGHEPPHRPRGLVARFYLDRGHPKGAILRIKEALRRYPDSGRDAELLLTLGETQLEWASQPLPSRPSCA